MMQGSGRFSLKATVLAASAALLLPGLLYAQHRVESAGDLARARAGVASMGREWNAHVNTETAKLYTPLHRRIDSSGIRRIRDIRYGPHRQQTLDLFVPAQPFNALSHVFVFMHDDTGLADDKIVAGSDDLLYSNVAKWAARLGGVGVNANYRLSPEAKWPSGPQDIRLLIQWLRSHVSVYGGDPDTILVLGNGVGAMHLASYLFEQASQPKYGPGIAGAILSSGAFETTKSRQLHSYFADAAGAHTPLDLLDSYKGKPVPILMWSAEYDPTESGVAELKEKLCSKYGTCPMFVRFAGHNHVSQVMSIDSDDTSVTDEIIRFYHSEVRK